MGDVLGYSQRSSLFTVLVITTLVRYLATSTFIKMLPTPCLFHCVKLLVAVVFQRVFKVIGQM